MAFIFGTSSNYQTFASILRRCAIGTSLQSITSVAAGGTGYVVGDILNVSGGTSVVGAQLEVLAVSSGAVTSARIRNAGLYTSTPANAVSVTGGSGTGATFNLSWGTNGWTSRRATNCPEAVQSATVAAGGTGYAVNDVLTVSGGTFAIAATVRVLTAPGGVVGTVAVVNQGDYTTAPANPASTTGGSGTGCTLNLTFGTGEREVILEGIGSGSDQIFVGFKSYNDGGSGARNVIVHGFTGFDSALSYNSQPGRSPGDETATSGADFGGAIMPLTNSTITWWISVKPRRIVAVARTGTCYASCYMGLLNPFATGGEWPYPIFICASTNERFRLPSSSDISTSGIADPITFSTRVGPGFVRNPAGSWNEVYNSTWSGTTRTRRTNGTVISPPNALSGLAIPADDNWFNASTSGQMHFEDFAPQSGNPGTQDTRWLPTTNAGGNFYIKIPSTLAYSDGTAPGGIRGEMDGVFWFDANATIVAENRLVENNDRFTVFQNGVRSDSWALWCLKED